MSLRFLLRRFVVTGLACLVAAPVFAQQAPPAPTTVRVSLHTSTGSIVVALDKAHAPITTANFLRYVDAKRLDGTTFYRAMKIAPNSGLIQAGISDPRRLFAPIAHEPTTRTGLSHVDGAISMARTAPGSAAATFFITIGSAMTGLDADPAAKGDKLGYAVFGRVVEGMDVVRKILAAPTSSAKGDGVMKGQMIAVPIRLITARRAD